MKNLITEFTKVFFSFFAIIAFGLTSCSRNNSNEEIIPIDTSIPKEVTIGKQVWMTKNLNVDKFRNGDPIPHAKTAEEWVKAGDNGEPAWCYYDNNTDNGDRYSKLYNWYALNDSRGLAPEGWKLPSDEDWSRLIDFLGGESGAGTKMKSATGWDDYGTNESGFSGLPAGHRQSNGNFYNIGRYGYWWSSSKHIDDSNYSTDSAYARQLVYSYDYVFNEWASKKNGFPVRCLRD